MYDCTSEFVLLFDFDWHVTCYVFQRFDFRLVMNMVNNTTMSCSSVIENIWLSYHDDLLVSHWKFGSLWVREWLWYHDDLLVSHWKFGSLWVWEWLWYHDDLLVSHWEFGSLWVWEFFLIFNNQNNSTIRVLWNRVTTHADQGSRFGDGWLVLSLVIISKHKISFKRTTSDINPPKRDPMKSKRKKWFWICNVCSGLGLRVYR